MVKELELDPAVFRLGKTKVFFRAGVLANIEERLEEKLRKTMVLFQARCRGMITRRTVASMTSKGRATEAARVIQRNMRAYLSLKKWPWWQLYCKV